MLNIRLVEDGDRIYLVIPNADEDTKAALTNIISSLACGTVKNEKVEHVLPVSDDDRLPGDDIRALYEAETELPDGPEPDPEPEDIPECDARTLYQMIHKEGFTGFMQAFDILNNAYSSLDEKQRKECWDVIQMYIGRLSRMDPETVKDDGLLSRAVWFLYTYVFPGQLEMCLKRMDLESLDDIMHAGRKYWETAYRICFGQYDREG